MKDIYIAPMLLSGPVDPGEDPEIEIRNSAAGTGEHQTEAQGGISP